jgi:pimeloyl-ACP methyl ester carboxylesterase
MNEMENKKNLTNNCKHQKQMIMRIISLAFILIAFVVGIANGQVNSGYAQINGIRMYYEIHGKGQTPLVLLHGGGSTIETSFHYLLPILASHRQVVAVDLQAHGRTSDRDSPVSFQQDADDVAALVRYLQIGKADFLGFSNGASTVLQIAIRHPDLVNKIVPISGVYRRDGLLPGFFEGMSKATLDAMPATLRDAFLKETPDSAKLLVMFQKDKQRMIDFKDWSDEDLRSIKAPAMIISSDRDVITPEHSVRMARMIPGARLVILPGVHGSAIGAIDAGIGKGYADVTAKLVEEFLGE